jgi:hypothetical protein
MSLLDNRMTVLQSTPSHGFWLDLEQLADKPTSALTAGDVDSSIDTRQAEQADLSSDAFAQVARMREANSGTAAYDLGAGLPEAVRSYTAGAVDFYAAQGALRRSGFAGHWSFSDPDVPLFPDDPKVVATGERDVNNAIARFRAVLALPPADSRSRATWAAYMLGRSLELRGHEGDLQAASSAFQQVRELAAAGFPDPLGLAVASLGEEARLQLKQEMISSAIALYAQQAMSGGNSALTSLQIVAEALLRDPARLSANIADQRVQRLLVAYVLNSDAGRAQFTSDLQLWRLADPKEHDDEDEDYLDEETATDSQELDLPNPIVTLVDAINLAGLEHVADVDRLAVLQYSLGQFDTAETLVARSNTPLAEWLKAKLALRSGNLDAAARHYAAAVAAFPTQNSSDAKPPAGRERIMGERGVLALARGEYVTALEYLYGACNTGHDCYSADVAYLAERILTLNELMAFVDQHVIPVATVLDTTVSENEEEEEVDEPWLLKRDLNHILARRLMREGRYRDAERYFADVENWDTDETGPALKELARAYADARHRADHAWTRVGRARGWFAAAEIARHQGMELLGYEGTPDVAEWRGSVPIGSLPEMSDGPFVTDGELRRASVTTPPLPVRFHYRRVAVEHAQHAADLLPPRSQAFAAVLCTAAGWMRDGPSVEGNDGRELALYRRYVREGAYVPWATNFGRNCAPPDFNAASRLIWEQRTSAARHAIRQYRWVFASAALILMGLAGWTLVRARRRRDRERLASRA